MSRLGRGYPAVSKYQHGAAPVGPQTITGAVALTGAGSSTVAGITTRSGAAALTAAGALAATGARVVTGAVNWTPGAAAGLLDNFDRANNSTLGTNWTQVTSIGTNRLAVNGNQARASGSTYADAWNVATYTGDQEIAVTLRTLDTGGAHLWLLLLIPDPAAGSFTGYLLDLVQTGTFNATLYRGVAGSYTNLGSATGVSYATGDVVTLRKVGSALTLLQNGTPVSGLNAVTDSSPLTAAGYAGIGGSGSSILTVDDFKAGVLGGGGGQGTLTATGTVGVPPVTGQASLTGTGALAAAGVRTRAGAVALTGAGTLATAGRRTTYTSAALTGTGTLAAAGGLVHTSAANLTGLGQLVTSWGVQHLAGTAILTGAGELSATAEFYTPLPPGHIGHGGRGRIDRPHGHPVRRPGRGTIDRPDRGHLSTPAGTGVR